MKWTENFSKVSQNSEVHELEVIYINFHICFILLKNENHIKSYLLKLVKIYSQESYYKILGIVCKASQIYL